jgi:D-sedoheptulose 7-phosphate isomerase
MKTDTLPTMQEAILASVTAGSEAIHQLASPKALRFIEEVSRGLTEAFRCGKKVIVAGNGGSLCDAMHFAEELTGQFRQPRRALPAIALSDPGHLTCTANDMGFDEVFARGVEAHGQPGDLFVGLTTSGNSPNIVRAFQVAKERHLTTVAFLGKDGGAVRGVADYELLIAGETSDRIQEAHMTAIHIIIEMCEQQLF